MKGIYGIKISNNYVYIGKSNNIERRIQEHRYNIYNSNEMKYKTLRSLVNAYFTYEFYLIEECEEERLLEREALWIHEINPPLNTKEGKFDLDKLYFDLTTGYEVRIEGERLL